MALRDLDSKCIVVTGGGGRLGSRMVEAFAKGGARVTALVVSDQEAARVPHVTTGEVSVRLTDVIDEDSVATTFRDIAIEVGSIDALVHTVGMWSASPLLETTREAWDLMLRVNLTSAFLCFREAARQMNGGGALIGISSGQGADRGVAEQAAYAAAKAGIVRLVESAADEFRTLRISCHAIAPSTILFDEQGEGVSASEIIELAAHLIVRGQALSGATLRAYGS